MIVHLILEAWKLIEEDVQLATLKCRPKCVISWFDLCNYIVELWCLLWQHVYVYKGLSLDM